MLVKLSKLTIVSEGLLRDRIIELIRRHGATGFTLTAVEGEGSRGVRASDWEGRNIQIETLVSKPVADAIMGQLAQDYFDEFAVIAWVSEVSVLRGGKFVKGDDAGTS